MDGKAPQEGLSRVESRKSSEWGERETTGALDEGKRHSGKREHDSLEAQVVLGGYDFIS